MNELQTCQSSVPSVFDSYQVFEQSLKMAETMSKSPLIPKAFQGNAASCLIALDLARRLRTNVLALFPHLYVIDSKPAFSTQFMITIVNNSGKFDRIEYEKGVDRDVDVTITDYIHDKKESKRVTVPNVWAIASMKERRTGRVFKSQRVDVAFAETNGWVGKPGSKWRTMPEQMCCYRAASMLIKTVCPELLLGMSAAEDVEYQTTIDVETVDVTGDNGEGEVERFVTRFNAATNEDELRNIASDVKSANITDDERRALGNEYRRRRDEFRKGALADFKSAITQIGDASTLQTLWEQIVESYNNSAIATDGYDELRELVDIKRAELASRSTAETTTKKPTQSQKANLAGLIQALEKANDRQAVVNLVNSADGYFKNGMLTQKQLIEFHSACDKRAESLLV